MLSVHAQYYSKVILDNVIRGRVFSVNPIPADKILIHANIIKKGTNIETDIIGEVGENKKLDTLKNFGADQWLFIYGRSVQHEKETYYYASRDIFIGGLDQTKVGWNFGILDDQGNLILNKKYPIKPVNGSVPKCYGLDLVKNNEVILWGAGNHPDNDPQVNNPYIIWMRVKKDGTYISGPHYYQPTEGAGWAIPTDAVVDVDGNLVLVYSRVFDRFIIKIKEDDKAEVLTKLILYGTYSDNAKLTVTSDSNFILTNYDITARDSPILTKIDRKGNKIWEKPLALLYGWRTGYYLRNTENHALSKIKEMKNGDLLFSGFNSQIDSVYVPNLGKKILKSGWTGGFIARYSPDGEERWVHYFSSNKDDGNFREMEVYDISEMPDGSIVVGGALGDKDVNSNSIQAWIMKLGPNGCLNPTCSHVDKWWRFPDEISTATEDIARYRPLTTYPNPGQNHINISLPQDLTLPIQYQITDINGRTHETGHQSQYDVTIDAAYLPSGMFHILIQDKTGKIWHGKWVKQ